MKYNLNEALPALIPEFPVEIAGHHLTLRFDVNINKTKKGIKLQFVMKDVPTDPREAQQLANEIGSELQQKFGEANLQIVYDVENPYKNVVGFLLPLPSVADFIMKNVLQGEPAAKAEEPDQELPDQEQAPEEVDVQDQEKETMKETIMKRAGLR